MNGPKTVLRILAGMLICMGAVLVFLFYNKGASTFLSAGGAFLTGFALLFMAHNLPSSKKEGEDTEQG